MDAAAQMTLPTFEGLVVDKFELSFGGKVDLNRGYELDEQLIKDCRIGETVRFVVEGTVVGRPFKWRASDDRVTSGARIKVISVLHSTD